MRGKCGLLAVTRLHLHLVAVHKTSKRLCSTYLRHETSSSYKLYDDDYIIIIIIIHKNVL